ncbi:uncharacterized protein Gasu_36810 [Galdieria sulphuraria]|uniref:Uncharacterized protein n=1 Tax=Galdieria sulphuraria TaxID=130081 RepID=M2VZL5_GALSU|nr:uncharacterized protein Gasu_36810 [Galdieria sulphuraria]EME28786.1 hypothetical protein Gasu_36810 [Galdieria sulphuraria]|eukprot:XP_005705306.1 hypothetical protein Gasu_36810 [Galdieria sulphuraria]
MPPFLIYPFFPASIMAISKSTQSPLGWPLFSNFLTPFPHSFSPIAISPLFPISNYPFFPSPPQWQFSNHDHLGVGPNWPLSPLIFPHRNFPTLSHFQFTHSFPPHTHNGNFQIKIARAHFQSACLFKLPIFPISRKNH